MLDVDTNNQDRKNLSRSLAEEKPAGSEVIESHTRLSIPFSFYLRFIAHDKPALLGVVVISLFLFWSLIEGMLQFVGTITGRAGIGWLLLGSNPLTPQFALSLQNPSLSSLALVFGTDNLGRSILTRILYAAPSDALVSILIVFSGVLIGMVLGTMAAYFGGWLDEVFMRLTDAFLALPALLLAIALSVLIGSGFESVLISLMIVWWPTYARFFRGQALPLKSKGFVEAAKLNGASSFRILFKHIIPNSTDPIIAYAALDLGNVILTYSALAFLGIGIQPPLPEWGTMASDGLSYLPQVWWWSLFPGLVILVVVASFTLAGDRLQDYIGGRLTY